MNDFHVKVESKTLVCILLCLFQYSTNTINGQTLKEVITETSAFFSVGAPFQPSQVEDSDLIRAPSGEGGGYDLC